MFAIRDKGQPNLFLVGFDGSERWHANEPPLLFATREEAEALFPRLWSAAWFRVLGEWNIEVVEA
jgi:hypothetical protein